MLQLRTSHLKKKQLCCNQDLFTYKKGSYAPIKRVAVPQYGTFLQPRTLFSGLNYYYINAKGNDIYERKKIRTYKKSSYAANKIFSHIRSAAM